MTSPIMDERPTRGRTRAEDRHPKAQQLQPGQIPMHPQGGGDLRLLMLFSAADVDRMRRASYAQAQAILRGAGR